MKANVNGWNREKVIDLLMNNNKAVENALLALYARQTADERSAKATKHSNGMGFTGTDAGFFTSLAEQVKKSTYPVGRKLSPKQLAACRKLDRNGLAKICKYASQLLIVIEAKAATAAAVAAAEATPIAA